MTKRTTHKKDVEVTVEELAGMVQRSFTHVEKNMATRADVASLRQQMATKEDLSGLEDKIDAKLDKILDRLDGVIDTFDQRITVLERQR